tara:strand:- start:615 stop:941 length:327 start_codon:yes stop_codon:yes gene_type:complete
MTSLTSLTSATSLNTYDRSFIFSSDNFSSYEVIGDIRYFDSLDNIIDYCVKDLIETLRKHNLVSLVEKCEKTHFHIHTHTFGEILVENSKACIYLCSGCKDKNTSLLQ